MKEIVEQLIDKMQEEFLAYASHSSNFEAALLIYNSFIDSEQDGNDYIFDLDKSEDLVSLIDGGLKRTKLTDFADAKYIVINENGEYVAVSRKEVIEYFKVYNFEIAAYILKNPQLEECLPFYQLIVVNAIYEIEDI